MADPSDPQKKPFKLHLAEIAWARHSDPDDAFTLRETPEPYEKQDGKLDPKLIDLVKTLWMRVLYGSDPETVARDQSEDPGTYGAGWTGYNAERFLRSLREFHVLQEFLDACRRIAQIIYRRDPYAGVTFTDPLDGEIIRWNPVKRRAVGIGAESHKIIADLPGSAKRGAKFSGPAVPMKLFEHAQANGAGDYPVDPDKLQNMVAPCLVHVLDAYFSSLVMERLAARKVRAFAGIHDCWMVPARVLIDGDIQEGLRVLSAAIKEAAKEWYAGLGPVYDDLLRHLGSDLDFGHVIRRAQDKWKQRVNDGYTPPFQATPG